MKLTIKTLVLSTTTFGLMLGVVQNAQAATIIPTAVMTPFLTSATGWNANNTINGAGLSGNTHAPSTTANAWLSTAAAIEGPPNNSRITFEFGSSHIVSGFDFWNLGGSTVLSDQGISTATIQASNDNGASWTTISTANFTAGGTGPSIAAQQITFAPIVAHRIRLIDLTRQGGGTTGGIGFSEIKFQGTKIPEPSALLALLAFGLAGVSLGKRI